ncbi:MAG: hypothetical protein B0W54_21470 [Cellvibrio sp. 79]|nr:MAG: hypothetical protein B0W54_21470 [Cellvibrio sp. 79]
MNNIELQLDNLSKSLINDEFYNGAGVANTFLVTPFSDEIMLDVNNTKYVVPREKFDQMLINVGFDLVSHIVGLVETARHETIAWLSSRKAHSGSLLDLQASKHKLAKIHCDIAVAKSFLNNSHVVYANYVSFHLSVVACLADLSESFDVCTKLNGGRGYLSENWYAKANDFIKLNRTGLPIARQYVEATESAILLLV